MPVARSFKEIAELPKPKNGHIKWWKWWRRIYGVKTSANVATNWLMSSEGLAAINFAKKKKRYKKDEDYKQQIDNLVNLRNAYIRDRRTRRIIMGIVLTLMVLDVALIGGIVGFTVAGSAIIGKVLAFFGPYAVAAVTAIGTALGIAAIVAPVFNSIVRMVTKISSWILSKFTRSAQLSLANAVQKILHVPDEEGVSPPYMQINKDLRILNRSWFTRNRDHVIGAAVIRACEELSGVKNNAKTSTSHIDDGHKKKRTQENNLDVTPAHTMRNKNPLIIHSNQHPNRVKQKQHKHVEIQSPYDAFLASVKHDDPPVNTFIEGMKLKNKQRADQKQKKDVTNHRIVPTSPTSTSKNNNSSNKKQ
ncbi:MAG TPA: hypothetical protein VLG38_00070 [Gammaproteobacteria bacterium]|nr:hypothetical protein [Gammaproteobacteria bacterium]